MSVQDVTNEFKSPELVTNISLPSVDGADGGEKAVEAPEAKATVEGGGEKVQEQSSEDGAVEEKGGGGLEPPKGLDASEKEWFASLDDAGKQAVIRKFKAMDAHFTKRAQELADLAKYADDPTVPQVLAYHRANPQAVPIMQFIENHPLLGPAVQKVLASFVEAKNAGKESEWSLDGALKADSKASEVPDLEKYASMDDEKLRDAMLEDPGLVRGLIKGMGAYETKIKAMLKPLEEERAAAKERATFEERLSKAVANLPDTLTKDEGGRKVLTPESASEIDAVLAEHGPSWTKQGKTPDQCLELAAEKVLANRKAAEAQKVGEEKAKEETRRKRQTGAPHSGGETTGIGGDLAKSLSERQKMGWDWPTG